MMLSIVIIFFLIIKYEDFKKEGRIMKRALKEGTITPEKFNDWIDSKKIKK